VTRNYDEFWQVMSDNSCFAIVSHRRMDGDAVGSMVALADVLYAMGKDVLLVNDDNVPEIYRFLTHTEKFVKPSEVTDAYEVVAVLDTGSREQLGGSARLLAGASTVVHVDHHLEGEPLGDVSIIDSGASAVGEMLFEIFSHAGIEISQQAATALYVALATDTGSFKFANTRARTHQVAAELISLGANPAAISDRVFDRKKFSTLKLTAAVLETLELRFDGQVASLVVTDKMIVESGAKPEETDGLVNLAKSVEGTRLALMFREDDRGRTKVSFRSDGSVQVQELAARFDGGGHAMAAGCTVDAGMQEARQQVFKTVSEVIGAARQ